MDGLEDKYAKYDFDEDDEVDEPAVSKPKFKKSVDLSKFEKDTLTEDELAEKERKAKELAEKKRRIIEGTNFDNSLRSQLKYYWNSFISFVTRLFNTMINVIGTWIVNKKNS